MERPAFEKPRKFEAEPEEEDPPGPQSYKVNYEAVEVKKTGFSFGISKKFKEMKEDTRILYNPDIGSVREKEIKQHDCYEA